MKKFVIIMASITAVCLILAVTLTAINKGNNPLPENDGNWGITIPGSGGDIDQTQEAPIEGVTSVSVKSSSDNIELHYGDEGMVRVHFHGTVRSSRRNVPVPELRMEQSGGRVSFWLDYPHTMGSFLYYTRNTAVDVYLPQSFTGAMQLDTSSGGIHAEGFTFSELSCNASSGSVKIENTSADTVTIDTSSGGIHIEGITAQRLRAGATSGSINGGDVVADVNLETSSGEIHLTGVTGNMEANTSSGTIQIENVADADKASAQASSGSIHMTFVTMGSDYRFDTSSGSVNLAFPSDAAFAIDFDTGSGSFHSDFPVTMTDTQRNSVKGYVVDDHNKVIIDTSSGSCNIGIN